MWIIVAPVLILIEITTALLPRQAVESREQLAVGRRQETGGRGQGRCLHHVRPKEAEHGGKLPPRPRPTPRPLPPSGVGGYHGDDVWRAGRGGAMERRRKMAGGRL